ncbi:MAG: hypothetical protein FWE35_10215 [Streptosporangiales bacterium]|nr:hypothetical protein [Streptosporangiales bacterium]
MYGKLTHEQDGAVRDYTGDAYGPLNKILRAERPLTGGFKDLARNLDQALHAQTVPENINVVRVTGEEAFTGAPMENLDGTSQHELGYMSTSLGSQPAVTAGAGSVILHLEVPAGTPGMYVDPISSTPGEREVLLGRGLRYQITGSTTIKGRWHVWGRVNR